MALADGRRLPWDLLALTTGAQPRRLPAEARAARSPGSTTCATSPTPTRSPPRSRPARRALVVGGGYIGLEAAAVLAEKGLAVTLIEAAPRILARVAAPATADFFRELHRGHGVDIREGAALVRLTGAGGRVDGAELGDGARLAADLALVGIGIEPDTALAEAAGLALENGVRVDGAGRTSDPRIFAAGDCTSFPNGPVRVRLESVPNAIDQGEAVAAAMLGSEEPYRARPWFWSDQYDVKLQIAGLNAGWERTVTRPGARPGTRSVWYYAGDRLLAVDAMNDPRAYMTAKRWIEAGVSPDPAAVADPAQDPQGARLMRIVGGRHRGLTLAALGGGDAAAHLRPTSDRVRESLFNLLAHGPYGDPPPPEGRRVLDLFAGTGALGLEALSRGARAGGLRRPEPAPAGAPAAQHRADPGRGGGAGGQPRRHPARRQPVRAVRSRLSRPALRPGPRRAGGRLGARRRLGGPRRARGLGGGRRRRSRPPP